MSNEYSSRVQLSTNGGLEALITLLNASVPDPNDKKAVTPPPDLLRNLGRALLLNMDEYDARAQLGKLGCIESLFLMLNSEFNEVQSLGLQCIVNAAKNAYNREIIRICGGLTRLIDYLTEEEMKPTHGKALEALASVLRDEAAMEIVSQRGPIDKQNPTGTPAPIVVVIDFIKAADHDVAIAAMCCVAAASANAANRRRFKDNDTEAAIVARLWSDDAKNPLNPRVGLAAVGAVIALAQGESNSEELATAGAIPRLTKLLSWDDEACQTGAFQALAVMTQLAQTCSLVVEVEALPKILEAMESEVLARVESAAVIVYNLASNVAPREALLELTPVAAVVKCVAHDDERIKTAGCKALCLLAQSQKCCAEIADIDGSVDALCVAASSLDTLLRKAALQTIRACATHKKLASLLCNAGVLETIQENVLSVGHPSPFATAAYAQLLDQNLSAKYGVRNQLGLCDTIHDGVFFDSGRYKKDQPFASLQTLQAKPVDSKRPVLAVNTSAAAEGGEAWAPPADPALEALLASVAEQLTADMDTKSKIEKLAQIVSDRMGGPVAHPAGSSAFSYELAIVDLKQKVGSNVVPLGELSVDNHKDAVYTYYHRALLFKVLADKAGVPSVLIRGEYNRAYNVVYLPESHVVGVTHKPGSLYPIQNISALHLASNFFDNISARVAVPLQ